MSIIKQISVKGSSSWARHDIGANASNISLSTNAAGGSNVQTALNNLVGTTKLTSSKVVITDANGKLSTSTIASSTLSDLTNLNLTNGTGTSSIQGKNDGSGALGNYSMAFGDGASVQDDHSFALGQGTIAIGKNSTALGKFTIAQSDCQTVIGKYNESDANNEYAFIIGNGIADTSGIVTESKNILTVDWNGDIITPGKITVGNDGYRIPLQSGNAINIVMDALTGELTTSSTEARIFIPYPFLDTTPSLTGLTVSIVMRHADGGYPYMRNGSTYTQLGASDVKIINNGTRVAGVSKIEFSRLNRAGFLMSVTFANALAKTSGNTAAVTNNVPIAAFVNLTGTLS